MFPCPGNIIFNCEDDLLGAFILGSFRKIQIFSLRDGDPRDSTPFPYITGAGQRDEDRVSQPTVDTASFYFTGV